MRSNVTYAYAWLLVITLTACSLHPGTESSRSERPATAKTLLLQPPLTTLPDDPTFVESRDTVSTSGPHSITRNMLQDRNGNYWFASWQGIIRYDGTYFTNLTLQAGLGHFRFFSVFEDRAGNLWFGSMGGGMYCYDGHYFKHFTTADGLAGNVVMCMQEDRSGNMWFGTNAGLSCYNGSLFTNFSRKDGLAHDSVYAMVQDNNGMLWFGTQGSVCSYYPSVATSGKGLAKIITEPAPFGNVRALLKDKAGNLWFGTTGGGLSRYDGKTFSYFGKKEGLVTNYIGCITEDQAGHIWVGGDVSRYDGVAFTRFLVRKDQSSNTVFCIFQDQSGDMWFCSTNGVYRYSTGSNSDALPGNRTEFNVNKKAM